MADKAAREEAIRKASEMGSVWVRRAVEPPLADDWLTQVRARFDYAEASDTDVGDLTAWYMQDVPRLLAAAEALRELVALRDDGTRAWRLSNGVDPAWERARRTLAGEGGRD